MTKKLHLFLTLMIFISVSSLAQSKKGFILKGHITGITDSSKVYFIRLDSAQDIDSITPRDGQFSFRGTVTEPEFFRIQYGNETNSFWVENSSMTLTAKKGELAKATITGSPLNKIEEELDHRHAAQEQRYRQLMDKVMKEQDGTKVQALLDTLRKIDREILSIRIDGIASTPPSLVTMSELYFLRNDLSVDSLKMFYDRFPPAVQNSRPGKVISTYITLPKLTTGSACREIEGRDSSGRMVRLSEFSGKVVLLDFWASWCGPCRKSFPMLRALDSTFDHKDLVILSYSIDTSPDSWKNAMQKDGVSWTSITDLKGYKSIQAAKYQVRAIPLSYLIDRKGVIRAIYKGYGEGSRQAMEAQIRELLK